MTTTSNTPITVTPKAVRMGKQRVIEFAGDSEVDPIGLRVGVKGGGCSGFYYVFEVATEVSERDETYTFDGLKVLVDKRSLKLLKGGVLDWEQKLMGYGFKWDNPNAVGDCGCGSSFNIA